MPGSRVNVVGPPLNAVVTVPLVEQIKVYHDAGDIDRFGKCHGDIGVNREVCSTIRRKCAELRGDQQRAASRGGAVLRGLGAPAAKSSTLLSVSVQPLALRKTAVGLVVAGAGAVSEKFAPSQPTKSLINANCAASHGVDPPLQASPVVELTRATLPPVATHA